MRPYHCQMPMPFCNTLFLFSIRSASVLELGAMESEATECLPAVVIQRERAVGIANGIPLHLTHKLMKKLNEGEMCFICSKYSLPTSHSDEQGSSVLRIHAKAIFKGNQFLTMNQIDQPSSRNLHGMNLHEYEMQRLKWPKTARQKNGATAWEFGLVGNMETDLFVANEKTFKAPLSNHATQTFEELKLWTAKSAKWVEQGVGWVKKLRTNNRLYQHLQQHIVFSQILQTDRQCSATAINSIGILTTASHKSVYPNMFAFAFAFTLCWWFVVRFVCFFNTFNLH